MKYTSHLVIWCNHNSSCMYKRACMRVDAYVDTDVIATNDEVVVPLLFIGFLKPSSCLHSRAIVASSRAASLSAPSENGQVPSSGTEKAFSHKSLTFSRKYKILSPHHLRIDGLFYRLLCAPSLAESSIIAANSRSLDGGIAGCPTTLPRDEEERENQ